MHEKKKINRQNYNLLGNLIRIHQVIIIYIHTKNSSNNNIKLTREKIIFMQFTRCDELSLWSLKLFHYNERE